MAYVSESPVRNSVNRASEALFSFAYKNVVKKFVFDQSPDDAHNSMIKFCQVSSQIPPLMWMLREMLDYTDPILETNVMGIDFHNPFGLSAGLDKNADLPIVLDAAGFGFETIGSITSRVCAGNARPWFHRLPEYASMMVHVGLANEGSEAILPCVEKAHANAKTMRISVSLARTNDEFAGDLDEGIEDYRISMERAVNRSHMIELNVSCPNTKAGEPFTDDPANLDKLLTVLDTVQRSQPTLIKMPSNKSWAEFKDLLDVIVEHNVQGVSIANLRKDRTGLDVPDDWKGNLSGLPCIPASNHLIEKTYRDYGNKLAIAGIGGVFTPQQAYEKIRKGSGLVMFITSLMYRGPQNITTLKRGVAELLRKDGFTSIDQAVGVDVE